MTARIVVFDVEEPRQRLMSWFLSDMGFANTHVTTLHAVRDALLTRPKVLIVNSTADIAALVGQVRASEGGDLRIIVLHDGSHQADEALIDADLCLHDVRDVEALIAVVKAALDDDVPGDDPHEAAESVVE